MLSSIETDMMKTLKEVLLDRRSIRRYERRAIEPEKVEFIYEAIRRIPTSYNGQQFSVVAVRDQAKKERLYEITGQKQIKTCALFLLFCTDYHRIRLAGKACGFSMPDYAATIDGHTVGVIDASLAMMAAATAAEGLGLGCCCVGYARTADPAAISELLELPREVTIVCGLTIGYPAEQPDIKPKLPAAAIIHEERYTTDEVLLEEVRAYDQQMREFNRTRAGSKSDNDWIDHTLHYYREEITRTIADYLRERTGMKSC